MSVCYKYKTTTLPKPMPDPRFNSRTYFSKFLSDYVVEHKISVLNQYTSLT